MCHDCAQVVQQRAARVARSQVSVHDRTLVCAQLVVDIIRQAINDVIAHGVRSALARTGSRRWATYGHASHDVATIFSAFAFRTEFVSVFSIVPVTSTRWLVWGASSTPSAG